MPRIMSHKLSYIPATFGKPLPKKCLHPSAIDMGYVKCEHVIQIGEVLFCGYKYNGCNCKRIN